MEANNLMAAIRSSGLISVSIDTSKVENLMTGYKRELEQAGDSIPRELAKMYAQIYLSQMSRATPKPIKPFTGQSFAMLEEQSVNPTRLGKNNYGVLVPSTLIALDQMETHVVALKRGREITQWARRFSQFKNKRWITVHPHHWIRSAHIRGGMRINSVIDREMDKVSKRAKSRAR